MKRSVLVALLALTWTASASAKHEDKQDSKTDQQQKICRRQQEIGSRLNFHRVCLTKEQWEQVDAQAKQEAQDAQQRAMQQGSKYGG